MTDFWSFLLQTLTASGAAALLLLVKALFRDKLSPRWQFSVWGILAVILLLPAGFFGRYVLLNWPMHVEALRSALTGRFGTLTRVVAPIPLPSFEPAKNVWDWLYFIYVAGVLLLLIRYAVTYIRLRLALKRGRPVTDGRVSDLAARYGLPVCEALEVEGLPSAFICGVFQPVLALPAGQDTDEKVILHELLHLKYRDAVWGLVICLFRCLHWCNPLLWRCADLAGNDLESLCDQRVLERLKGEERRDYGRILLEMADEKYARAPGTSSMANGGKNIRRRIEAIARFKRYPAGMATVSVCVALVLALPLLVGTPARALWEVDDVTYRMASARTTPCTTYAGAFDTYAKAVITGRTDYRAMCAPLSMQDELVQSWDDAYSGGNWMGNSISWKDQVDRSAGFWIYNLTKAGDGYEGILVLTLTSPPDGQAWSGIIGERWLVLQSLRAEKEDGRWVVVALGEPWTIQGDVRIGGNLAVPSWEYIAQAGDFTLRLLWKSASYVESREEPNFFGTSTFSLTPVPNGEFVHWYYQTYLADYNGAEADKGRYQRISVSAKPLWGDTARPVLSTPNLTALGHASGTSNGEDWSSTTLGEDWESPIYIAGSGSMRDGLLPPPECYAADLYINGEKMAELTLLLTEGGKMNES